MKLSQALRKGIKVVPNQMFNEFFAWRGDKIHAACGLSTMYVGAGYPPNPRETLPPHVEHLVLATNVTVCCPASGRFDTLCLTIQRLNDEFRWTRERQADWLETCGF